MIATVRLDENLENTLNRVSKILDKKKSEVIREAIIFYLLGRKEFSHRVHSHLAS